MTNTEVLKAAEALLSDIEDMFFQRDKDEYYFGVFSTGTVDWKNEGFTVSWPNLYLSAERLRTCIAALKATGSPSQPTTPSSETES